MASGHAPVGPVGRDVEIERAEPGAVGLPVCLSALLGGGASGGPLSPLALARALSHGPAEVLGLSDAGRLEKGARADLVIVDPHVEIGLSPERLGTPTTSCPLLGHSLFASLRATLVEGRLTHTAPGAGA